MRTRREPFYGQPEDLKLLPESERERFLTREHEHASDFTAMAMLAEAEREHAEFPATHPYAVEKGIELPLGYRAHQGENRTTRRAAVANWQPPKQDHGSGPAGDISAPPPPMPTRRELLAQRQRQRRGKLDPELRRLQRKALSK